MKDKILCWFDGFPPQFGIVKYLQEIYSCELFAIIDVNSARGFYEKQDIVKFKKKWYYRDYIKNDENFELEYLIKFEKKYNIDLWKIVYSDPILNNYNKHYKFNHEEILKVLEQECKFFEMILDEVQPNFLIMRITDSNETQILQKMCKIKGIKILTLGLLRFGKTANISEEMDTIDYDVDIYDKEIAIKTWDDIKKILRKYEKQQNSLTETYQTSKKNFIFAALKFIKLTINPKYSQYYRNYGRNIFKIIFVELKKIANKRYRKYFINQKFLKTIDLEDEFVYFPLHVEPERTLFIPAPYYTNQINIIENIARSLPVNFFLYVKEHPFQGGASGWRKVDDYKKILRLPNVKLIHPDVSNELLLKNCSLVITIAGTLGLQAALYKKPSIVFTDTIYSKLPSISKVTNLEELPIIIKKALKKTTELNDMLTYVKKILNNSFEFDIVGLEEKYQKSFYYGGFLFDVLIDEEKVKEFLIQNEKLFRNLAEEHVKKIEQHKKYLRPVV